MTNWLYVLHIICPVASVATAIHYLDLALPKDDGQPRDSDHPESFCLPLSSSGSNPITHWGVSFCATDGVVTELANSEAFGISGIKWWRASNLTGVLEVSNVESDQGSVGLTWDWANCLSSVGLQKINPPDPEL